MKKNAIILFIVLTLASLSAKPTPPIAPEKPVIKSVHGVEWTDEYDYMREHKNLPEVMKYIKAENKYTQKVSKSFHKLQNQIFDEMKNRIREDDVSVPYKKGDWFYYYEIKKGQSYGINYRINLKSKEKQILLDENNMAKGKTFFSVGTYQVSPNDSLLAYSVDFEGAEQYTMMIKNIRNNQHYSEKITNAEGVVWFNDSKTFLYSLQDEKYRTYRIYKHILGTDPANDELIMEENDEAFYLSAGLSRSKEYIMISSSSKTTTENWYLSANHPNDKPKLINSRRTNIEIYPDHFNGKFFIYSNEYEANYQYYEVLNENDFNKTRLLFSGNQRKILNDVLHFKDYMIVSERIDGQNRIRVINRENGYEFSPDFDSSNYSIVCDTNLDPYSDSLRFSYDSMTEPSILYQVNLKELESNPHYKRENYRILKQYNPQTPYDKSLYEEKTVYVEIDEQTQIPMMLVYRKDLFKGNNPCLLYAYGSYGSSEDPYFSSARLSLLDRGWIYAVAQIRGGGELGKEWHEQGRLLNRKNTFNDFIACAEYLIKEDYTSREKLSINGGSAGGMLIGAVINQRPELFHAVVADVPFVDVLSTMLDSTLALTIPEYEEWGNPYEKEYFDYIASYSPYDHVKTQSYPYLLINAGFRDSRVAYWEPLKWTAKLRKLKQDKRVLLLKMNMNEGHSGSGDRYSSLRETAFTYAFLLWTMEKDQLE
ncbi:MAG TPA: S9 family peptidase [Candidatus Cloacimonadota bacterium]|nr:S9 family peptidase [Candidatus Cloacimonadota bacterium]